MIFRRNIFYPIRLILYPACLQLLIIGNGSLSLVPLWYAIYLISGVLLVEAIWEFIVPYAELNGSQLVINSFIGRRKRIDLSEYTMNDVKFDPWFLQIGEHVISLRRIRRDYREPFEDWMENYFAAKDLSTGTPATTK